MIEIFETLSLKTNETKKGAKLFVCLFYYGSVVHLLSALLAMGAMYFTNILRVHTLKEGPLTSQGFLFCCSLNLVRADLSQFMQMPAGARLLGESLKSTCLFGIIS